MGGPTVTGGPVIEGNGSKRASAWRIAPDGGSTLLSPLRIAERWIALRRFVAPGVCNATAPTTAGCNPRRAAPSAGSEPNRT